MRDAERLRSYSGTLLWKDKPILDFTVIHGHIERWDLHPENEAYYIFEFQYNPTLAGLQLFLDNRIVPETRQNIQEVLADLGLQEYNVDDILKANYGLCTDDCYWFRPQDSDLKYDDIKIRD